MEQTRIQAFGDELYQAMLNREAVAPLTDRGEDITINDAYHISLRMLERRLADGASVIGKKIGVTSKAVQNMLNVHQPDFGYLTDDMVFNSGEVMPISDRLIAPRAEGDQAVSPRKVDLVTCGMVVEKNGSVLSAGAGAAALGSPVNCVTWLANTLGEFGITLKAGEVILSGSLVPLEPVKAGDYMRVDIGGIGSASVRFA